MDNLLFALDLTNFDINETPNPDLPDVEDDDLIPLQEHLARNEQAFAAEYGTRSLGHLNIVQAPSELYASRLRHNFIKPQFYRPNDILRDASLASFVSFMETFRQEEPNSNEAGWSKVLESRSVRELMREYRRLNNEIAMREWFSATMWLIKRTLKKRGPLLSESEKLFGLGGALAYTNPETHAPVHDAAFLSYVDKVFKSGVTNNPFAGVEFKHAPLSHNRLWYKVHPAALAQTLSALAGHPDCVVSLFLCNYGFRIIWRERLPLPVIFDGREVPVYQHFTFPPIDATHRSPHLCYCYSGDRNVDVRNFEGLRDLLRVMFEFVLTSIVPVDQVEPESPVQRVVQPQTDSANSSSMKRRRGEVDFDDENSASLDEYNFGAMSASGKIDFSRAFISEKNTHSRKSGSESDVFSMFVLSYF